MSDTFTFRSRFNSLYEESGLNQEDFGKKFGASKSQVFHWRNGGGEPDSEMLKEIAKVTGVSVDWLVGKSNNVDTNPQKNPDLAYLSRAGDKMTPDEAKKLHDLAALLFPQYFTGDDPGESK
ncbi:MAG: hypothetical protein H6Q76_406 [Firmicutes bacterium]|nr:hypothetical protein [Bacillota bacterium]